MIDSKRKNLSKSTYDLGKLTFAGLVIGYFINPAVKLSVLILGIISTVLLFVIAYLIDLKEE